LFACACLAVLCLTAFCSTVAYVFAAILDTNTDTSISCTSTANFVVA
jgi:hypothetical protein